MKKTLKYSVFLILIAFISFLFISPNKVVAASTDQYLGQVQLGGDTIGIQIKTKVEIVGKYEIVINDEKIKPWENSDIQEGDYIYSVNDVLINSNNDLNNIISNTNNSCVNVVLLRNNEMIKTSINIVKNANNKNTIGLYIKDHITGIGTLTFVNKNTNKYGALGHSVSDALSTGKLYESSIKGIKKAIKGVPGEKFATLSPTEIGTIENNTNIGIFGEYKKELTNEIVNVVKSEHVQKGKAEIVTVIEGNIIKKYDIEIIEVNKQNKEDIKGIKFKVTDKELLEEAGGIIQGMSGSPIIQNGNLVGAVSHVVVNDPICGFGVFAEWMYYKTL